MISDAEKLALLKVSKDLTPLELIEATCEACKATFINSDIARKEREECAKTVEDLRDKSGVNEDGNAWLTRVTKGDCVQAIRARGRNANTM
jgi:hypothetical protein